MKTDTESKPVVQALSTRAMFSKLTGRPPLPTTESPNKKQTIMRVGKHHYEFAFPVQVTL